MVIIFLNKIKNKINNKINNLNKKYLHKFQKFSLFIYNIRKNFFRYELFYTLN